MEPDRVLSASNTKEKKNWVGRERIMRSKNVTMLVFGLVALVATSCAVTEERSGPGADGIPVVSAVCVADQPDCEDTVVVTEPQTGGPTPTAPDDSEDRSPSSGFVVGSGLTITEALAYDGTEVIAVGGFSVTTADGTLFCEALAESFPPQCGGPSLSIQNPETLSSFVLLEEGGTQWSPEPIVLLGHILGTEFTVASNVSG